MKHPATLLFIRQPSVIIFARKTTFITRSGTMEISGDHTAGSTSDMETFLKAAGADPSIMNSGETVVIMNGKQTGGLPPEILKQMLKMGVDPMAMGFVIEEKPTAKSKGFFRRLFGKE